MNADDIKVILFHSEREEPHGFLSNWFPMGFVGTRSAVRYNSVEQYFMSKKAIAMGDADSHSKIMAVNPNFMESGVPDWDLIRSSMKKIKSLGRAVKPWDQEKWDSLKLKIMLHALICKFSQNEQLRAHLFDTGDALIIEASPTDKVWGIGISPDQIHTADPSQWGQNLLGKCLMQVRSMLMVRVPKWAIKIDPRPIKNDIFKKARSSNQDATNLIADSTVEEKPIESDDKKVDNATISEIIEEDHEKLEQLTTKIDDIAQKVDQIVQEESIETAHEESIETAHEESIQAAEQESTQIISDEKRDVDVIDILDQFEEAHESKSLETNLSPGIMVN